MVIVSYRRVGDAEQRALSHSFGIDISTSTQSTLKSLFARVVNPSNGRVNFI
jgi:hypothetical protein